MAEFADLNALETVVGTTIGPSATIEVTQDMVDRFAELTRDHQWIHVDVERAAASPLGTTIAHGYLTPSFVAPFLEELVRVGGVESAVNYGADRLRFPAPLPAESVMSAEATPISFKATADGAQVVISVVMQSPSQPKPVCAVDVVVRYVAADASGIEES